MDSRKRPEQGRNQNGQQNDVTRSVTNFGARQHAVHKTPEELARTRVVPAVKGQNARPSYQSGRPAVRKTQSDNLEFSVAPASRNQTRQNSAPSSSGKQDYVQVKKKPKGQGASFMSGFGKVIAFILVTIVFLLSIIIVPLRMIGSNSNPAAQGLLVTTLLETGQLKFLANIATSQANIDRIVNENKSDTIDEDVDTSLIDIRGATGNVDVSGGNATTADTSDEPIVIEEIAGASYHATMMIVKDPSRVSVATIYPWREEGDTLDQIANSCGAIGAINGGIYNSYNNSGGMPYGVVVSNHEIQYNRPEDFEGLYLIGLTDDNILVVIDINGWTAAQVESTVNEKNIRDAVTFQEEATDSNNHFVQLIINGEKRDLNGKAGSGLNPRTAIGQRADGTILMLVTDGRGKSGHLGASASDLIDIMDKYGAVNAVNLDGGSSSCMYYNGEYLMTSVTFYYTNASWKLPLAFVVK